MLWRWFDSGRCKLFLTQRFHKLLRFLIFHDNSPCLLFYSDCFLKHFIQACMSARSIVHWLLIFNTLLRIALHGCFCSVREVYKTWNPAGSSASLIQQLLALHLFPLNGCVLFQLYCQTKPFPQSENITSCGAAEVSHALVISMWEKEKWSLSTDNFFFTVVYTQVSLTTTQY